MDKYIAELRLKWNHPNPKKRQLSPYKHTPIVYGAKIQCAMEPPYSPPLEAQGILCIQSIVGALLYYARAVTDKLLVSLNELGQQQASTAKDTNAALFQLLDYVVTYPNYGILYQASGMVLASNSDAAYLMSENHVATLVPTSCCQKTPLSLPEMALFSLSPK